MQPSQNLSPWTLRLDGIFLMLAGGLAMIAETVGHFFGAGPFASDLGSPHTIGGFEAHGLAFLIGVLLLRGARLADRRLWHRVGFVTHLFLGSANLLFWTSFVQQGLLAAGYVTTSLHIVLVVVHAIGLRSGRPASA